MEELGRTKPLFLHLLQVVLVTYCCINHSFWDLAQYRTYQLMNIPGIFDFGYAVLFAVVGATFG